MNLRNVAEVQPVNLPGEVDHQPIISSDQRGRITDGRKFAGGIPERCVLPLASFFPKMLRRA